MSATNTLRTNPKYLDKLNQFLTEDEVGKLFNQAITEKVLAVIPVTHDQANHGTIFRSGFASGAASIRSFIDDFDPIALAEKERQKAADAKIRTPTQLPSVIAAQKLRQEK
jgi:hypothetical protein